jgi:hypothetical protein
MFEGVWFPEPETRNPKPETRHPSPVTRHPEPGTWNPEPGTQNRNLELLDISVVIPETSSNL